MSLNVKALAIAAAALVGGTFFAIGALNQAFPTYGLAFLELGASIYPGYDGPGGARSVLVVTVYGLADGATGGALLGWLYNLSLRPRGVSGGT